MKLQYVPLLPIQQGLQALPRDSTRFQQYLGTVLNADRSGPELTPLLLANPMAKDHVTQLVNELIALDADGIAARTVAEVSSRLVDEPGDFDAGLVVVDDLMGGWTNRYATEYTLRFQSGPPPQWLTRRWVYGVLWSSEPASEQAVRDAMATALYRMVYVQRHGHARTLRDKLVQEGHVLTAAECESPTLDPEDLAYTREVLVSYLDADDMATTIQCLFGDAAGGTLGFAPLGLSPWAGLALALHDGWSVARTRQVLAMVRENTLDQ